MPQDNDKFKEIIPDLRRLLNIDDGELISPHVEELLFFLKDQQRISNELSKIPDEFPPVFNNQKPPLGVKPRFIHDEERAEVLAKAIHEYIDEYTISEVTTKGSVYKWITELKEILDRYQNP